MGSAILRLHNKRYDVYDASFNGLMISVTIINPYQETRGHQHTNEEFYFVAYGQGKLQTGEEINPIGVGDTLTIKPNEYHKICNKTNNPLIVVCCWRET